MKKRLTQLALALWVILPLLAMNVWAAAPTDPAPVIPNGAFMGPNNATRFTWRLEKNELIISRSVAGNGEMKNFAPNSSPKLGSTAPWSQYRDDIVTITIDEGISSIGDYAFKDCNQLTIVKIPSSVTTIGANAFENCSALLEVKIPDGVTTIGAYAFQGCNKLQSLLLYPDLKTVYVGAFSSCPDLKNVYYHDSESKYKNNVAYRGKDDKALSKKQMFPRATVHYVGTYTVSFYLNAEPGTAPIEVKKTNVYDQLDSWPANSPVPPSSCYTFDDAWLKADGSELELSTVFTEDTNLYAKWIEKHAAGVKFDATEATCTKDGNEEGTKCPDCGKTLTGGKTIPATGIHELDETKGKTEKEIKAATCTESGLKEVAGTCKDCNKSFTQEVEIPALGHDLGVLNAKDPTCTETGLEEGEGCQREGCGYVEVEQKEVKAQGHEWDHDWDKNDFGDGVQFQEPTCTENGVTEYTRTCSRSGCGEVEKTYMADIPDKGGHKMTDVPAVAATCTAPGKTEGKKCVECGETTQEEIPALEHAWVKTEAGTEEVTKKATCTEAGSMTIKGGAKCSRDGCTETKADEVTVVLEALSKDKTHTWDEGKVDKEPTATEKGVKIYTCTVCGETKTEDIAPLEHEHDWDLTGATVTTKEPTCTEAGSRTYTGLKCSHCDETSYTEVIPATGEHTWDEGTVTTEPTATDKGVKTYTCTVCNTTKTEEIPATGTSDKPDTPDTPDTPTTPTTPSEPDSSPRYRIYTPNRVTGGSYTVNYGSAYEGTRVTIRINPRRDYYLDWLSVTNLTTGRELTLTERDWDEFTFIMPDSSVELDISYRSGSSGGTGGGYIAVPPQAKPGPTAWYYANQHIYHVTTGLLPDSAPITRDMLISVLYNLSDHSAETGTSVGAEANNALLWAVKNNIVPDFTASGLSGLDKAVTREQAAMLLFRGAGHNGYSVYQRAGISYFADYSQVREIARDALSWAVATGLMNSTSPSTLSPRETVSCGQMGGIINLLTRMQ